MARRAGASSARLDKLKLISQNRRPFGCEVSFSLDSVGINRREVVNERVIQERSSDHPDPEPCEGEPQGRT
jgi:hypothetical protein